MVTVFAPLLYMYTYVHVIKYLRLYTYVELTSVHMLLLLPRLSQRPFELIRFSCPGGTRVFIIV